MKDERLYLDHILERINRIMEFTEGGRKTLVESILIQDAVLRNFEIIGEATRKIPDEVRQQYPEVPWSQMAAFRNVLIHDYDRVNIETVWRVIEEQLPKLKPQVEAVLEALNAKYGTDDDSER